MLAWEPYVEAKALQAQGWSISAIARHLGVTRLTVRRYLNGERTPGQRARATADPFAEYVEYCRLRLGADPHLWATTLFDEVVALGYSRVVSVVHPGDPGAGAAAALRGVSGGQERRPGADRAPAGRGNPVGLPGADRPAGALGVPGQRVRADRCTAALGALARLDRRVDRPAAPDRGPRAGRGPAGWGHAAVAVRPDGHGVSSRLGPVEGQLRPGRGALPGRDRCLPVSARLAQGRGGEERARHRATLVAHPERRRHPRPGSGRAGPGLRPPR